MTDEQQAITQKFEKTEDFLPYIQEIRFPMFKSLEDGLCLNLDWPIVALVGPNGTNKSSILQAISAAPEGRSLAPFWFSTRVDDIDKGIRGRAGHRFLYKYRFDDTGVLAECRKYRGKKKYRAADFPRTLRGKRDPDYWEPTKRVASDEMAPIPSEGFDEWLSSNRDRWNQIRKNVVYLDFRSELSAFDKYIHHQAFDRWTPDSTQKRYRAVVRSRFVALALDGHPIPQHLAGKLIRRVEKVSSEDVKAIAKILGKPIEGIDSVEHSFFGPPGFTVRLRLSGTNATYSEAHAGSGEYAVVRLVTPISAAPERSLILLDEPEVSLHPGAQVEMMRFIEQQVLRKGHQVVISTHSPSLAAGLPPRGIMVFGFEARSQRIALIADGCSPEEAFAHLGHATSWTTKPRIIVEDDLAAEIVRASLRRKAPGRLKSLDIEPFPGGAHGIIKHVLPALALGAIPRTGILLDGDQAINRRPDWDEVLKSARTAKVERDLAVLKDLWIRNCHKTVPNLFSNTDHATDVDNRLFPIEGVGRGSGVAAG